MQRKKRENMWNQVQRFSIRKFSFGVTSALLGTFFLVNTSTVQANSVDAEKESSSISAKPIEIPKDKAKEENTIGQSGSMGNLTGGNLTGNSSENATEIASSINDGKSQKVDKSVLSELVENLSTLLNNVNRKKVSKSSIIEFEGILSTAREALQNDSLSQDEIDSQVRKVRSSISIAKSLPKEKNLKNEASEEKEKSSDENKIEKNNKESLVSSESDINKISNNTLQQIQQDIQEYLQKLNNTGESTDKKVNVENAKTILANISE